MAGFLRGLVASVQPRRPHCQSAPLTATWSSCKLPDVLHPFSSPEFKRPFENSNVCS
jgi:hypothetical protein